MTRCWGFQKLLVSFTVFSVLSIGQRIDTEAADELAEGVGLIHTVAPDQTSVNLTHDPIPEVGWPAMTMSLDLSERAQAQSADLKPGTVIQFTLERDPEGIFQISDFQVAPEGTLVNAVKGQGGAAGPMDHDSMDHDSMDHDSMDHDSMDHDSMDHDSMDHDSMDHDSMDHGEHGHNMILDDEGMVMNANSDRLPEDCSTISQDRAFTIQVGRRHAVGRPGVIYGYDKHEIRVQPCSRVKITLVNDDSVRHQWMVHGLPRYLYPQGMFHLEVSGKAEKSGVFIVPSDDRTYLVHCDMPQHMEKGLKGQVVVGKGNGDLSSIPGISGPLRSNTEGDRVEDWNQIIIYALGTSAFGVGLVAFAGLRKPS